MRIIVEAKMMDEVGLHARPAAQFTNIAREYKSNIVIKKDGSNANGKSLMSILKLNINFNDTILIEIDGEDAREAANALCSMLINNGNEVRIRDETS